MASTVVTWQGKNVEDMTKSELIEALIQMSELYEQALKQHSKDLTMLGELR